MSISRKRIFITVTGESALLIDGFGDHAAEQVSRGTSGSISARHQVEPRVEAERRLYKSSEGKPIIPGPNMFAALIAAGSFIKTGRKTLTTTKSSLVPACVTVIDIEIPIARPDEKEVVWEVDRRSVVIPATGGRIMCHRPRFDVWSLSFTVEYDSSMINEATVRELVDHAGGRIGIGVFRPARRGPFGRFRVDKWEVQK